MARTGRALRPPILMFVTDRGRTSDATTSGEARVVADAIKAARAGVDVIQIRERGLEDRDLLALSRRIVRETASMGADTIVNDRFDVALAAGAQGVHLPARGMSSRAVRAIAPDGFRIGRSVHSEAEAVAAQEEGGCDYLIFGSVFESASKPPGHPVAGLDSLARACRNVALPVLAIGGITRARVAQVAAAGAAGIAAIRLFADADAGTLSTLVPEIRSAFGSR